jgi:hypothetical protein
VHPIAHPHRASQSSFPITVRSDPILPQSTRSDCAAPRWPPMVCSYGARPPF